MYTIKRGNNSFKRDGRKFLSILDVTIDNHILLSIFEGSISPNDFLVKYKDTNLSNKFRTPKHIHWLVDLLIKKEKCPKLTTQLILQFQKSWDKARGLNVRSYEKLEKIIMNSEILKNNSVYEPLNQYGYYKIEFLIILMELLIIQEKTNNPNAYMFSDVIDNMLTSKDLFKIISTATHR